MEQLIRKCVLVLAFAVCLVLGCGEETNPDEREEFVVYNQLAITNKQNLSPNSIVEWSERSQSRSRDCLAYWRNKGGKRIALDSIPVYSDSLAIINDCLTLNGNTTFKDTLDHTIFARWPHHAVGQLLVTFDWCGKTVTKIGTAWLLDMEDGRNRYLITAAHVIVKKIQCGSNDSTIKVIWPKSIVFAPNIGCKAFYCAKDAFVFQEFTYNPKVENQYDFAGIVLDREVDCGIFPIRYKVLPSSANNYSALAFGITDKQPQLQHPYRLTQTGSEFCMPNEHHYRMENSLTPGGSGGPVVILQDGDTFAFSINGWREKREGEGNFLYLPRPNTADIDSLFFKMKNCP